MLKGNFPFQVVIGVELIEDGLNCGILSSLLVVGSALVRGSIAADEGSH
jgi:hypothetical protein